MSEPVGDYGFAVKELLEYLKDKGQIWSAAQLASIILVHNYIKRRYNVDLGLGEFIDSWISMSVIEAAKWETVAQKNVEKIGKLSAQVNYVEDRGTRTRVLPLTKSRRRGD